ncbi:MAG: tRNA uridine-5-carboxymethylaminomethyl modification enzyme MnmG/GidA [Phycisphaerales bacterium]
MFARTILVVGGGHAGLEAARAASSALGGAGRVILLTMDPSKIGAMSCNPAIGGLAKGQMVREIDALGGLMGRAADASGISFKVLNASRGAAVRGPRAQCDKEAYAAEAQRLLAEESAVEVWAGTLEDLELDRTGRVGAAIVSSGTGPVCADRAAIESNGVGDRPARPIYPSASGSPVAEQRLAVDAVVVTTGTFMRAIMHTGASQTPGGRVGEGSATSIATSLRGLGFELGRLKTGTPPRLTRSSLDLESLPEQRGDSVPTPFSDLSPEILPGSRFPRLPQVVCWETATTSAMHALIRANLHRAPMYSGAVEAECGPRYCPSIEDKVVRFADRESHHVFLEPETLGGELIYCNGISTSLPAEIQIELVRSMAGCARAEIARAGYAVEYDMVWPHQIDATAMTKRVPGLFLAGQINGTSGYEEAAGQGLIAGLNAARFARGEEPARLGRETSYLGVMMDDLVTRTPREPYRMFTSRAEHRLRLRADNADVRLTRLGHAWGLVDARRLATFERRMSAMETLRDRLVRTRHEGRSLKEWLRKPELDAAWAAERLGEPVDRSLLERLAIEARYEGYLARQEHAIRRAAAEESVSIPESFDPGEVVGLRSEAVEVLRRFRPATLGQAGRLAGVNPADLSLVSIALERRRRAKVS